MTNENEAQRFVQSPEGLRLRGEETPDVEGHIRKVHTAHETLSPDSAPGSRIQAAEGLEDDGPDVEGHIFRA